jgi:formate-dependent nitrite reductase membrane component NrfD
LISDLVIAYLFFGGAGAGTLLISSLVGIYAASNVSSGLSSRRGSRLINLHSPYNSLLCTASLVGLASLSVGALCLYFDLGCPEKAVAMLASPTFSLISIGALSIGACIMSGFICLLLYGTHNMFSISLLRISQICCVVSAAIVVVYIGFFLGASLSTPFWGSWFIPVLFSASALSCGAAVTTTALGVNGIRWDSGELFLGILIAEIALLLLELVVSLIAAFQVSSNPSLVYESVWRCWPLYIGAGIVAPILADLYVLLTRERNRFKSSLVELISALLVVSGGAALRAIIALSGVPEPLIALMGT